MLSSHVDDGELGCGGTISRFIEEGSEVIYMAFSSAKESIVGDDKEITTKELHKAMKVYGIKDSYVLTIPVRKFPVYRQIILDTMLSYKKKYPAGTRYYRNIANKLLPQRSLSTQSFSIKSFLCDLCVLCGEKNRITTLPAKLPDGLLSIPACSVR